MNFFEHLNFLRDVWASGSEIDERGNQFSILSRIGKWGVVIMTKLEMKFHGHINIG